MLERNIVPHPVVTTVVVPLLLSYSVLVKGVFSPSPPYLVVRSKVLVERISAS